MDGYSQDPKPVLKLVRFAKQLHKSIEENEGANFLIHLETFPSLKTGAESRGVGAAQIFLQERKIQSLIKENIVHCDRTGNALDYYTRLQEDIKGACLAADAKRPTKGSSG